MDSSEKLPAKLRQLDNYHLAVFSKNLPQRSRNFAQRAVPLDGFYDGGD